MLSEELRLQEFLEDRQGHSYSGSTISKGVFLRGVSQLTFNPSLLISNFIYHVFKC